MTNYYNENIKEKVLQQLILEDILSFLKQLGEGFTFIENEYVVKYCNDSRVFITTYKIKGSI